ncbi:MAG TPA: hypothetical protein VKS21_00760, partial [Spirochaetota bacterium]|nr:hypothetical protein [Spirochaetota bacterium]
CSPDPGVEPEYLGGLAGTEFNMDALSTNAGIFPEQGWDAVLDDPHNPFREGVVGAPSSYEGEIVVDGMDGKWQVSMMDTTNDAAVHFYAWATVLAAGPSGENQFYTAEALKGLYEQTGNNVFSNMAVRAYQSVLLNFHDAVTDTTGDGDFIYIATWAIGPLTNLGGDALGYKVINDGTKVEPPPEP